MMNRNNIIAGFVLIAFQLVIYSGLFPCTMILAGKESTAEGSVLLAHNNDLPETISSLIRIVPAKQHAAGEIITFKNGLRIPQAAQTYRMLIMNCFYGYAEGDARAINEYQVAVAGGTSLVDDRNDNARESDPLITGGVSGYIRYIALQRAKTARECVEIIGKMYSKYGIAYPSGVGVADPDEVWYIEAGGGKCWAAQRIPDHTYLVAANGFRLGNIDFNDKINFIYPPYLKSYALKKKLWKPGEKNFNFSRIFGGKTIKEHNYYNARRVWRIQSLLTPSLEQNPHASTHPFVLKPDEKITIPHLISILRDYYKGTPFDISGQTTATSSPDERAIAVFETVHTGIIQLRSGLPPEIGAVMWGGLSTSLTTPYIPYYFGINDIPTPYEIAGPRFDKQSAFRNFQELAVLLKPRFSQLIEKILPAWRDIETRLFSLQAAVEKTAVELYKNDKQKAKDFLTFYSNGLSLKALEMAKELKIKLKTKLTPKK